VWSGAGSGVKSIVGQCRGIRTMLRVPWTSDLDIEHRRRVYSGVQGNRRGQGGSWGRYRLTMGELNSSSLRTRCGVVRWPRSSVSMFHMACKDVV
jgi:hypothetical protein